MAQQTATNPTEKVPTNYTLCLKDDCPKAANCLRHAAVAMMPAEVQAWRIVSPTHLAQVEGECPYYRSTEKVRYARGFVKMLSGLTVKQAHAFRLALEHDFGHTRYFRLRAGERLIDPATQEHIRQVMTRIGVTPLPDFDAYVEKYAW